MKIFLSIIFDKKQTSNLGVILASLRLFQRFDNWQDDPATWDPAAWQDWLDGVNKTLQDLNITQDRKTLTYDTWTAFLCMKNFLQLFHDEIPYEDIGDILNWLATVKQTPNNPVWQAWVTAVNHAINATYNPDEPLEG